MVATLVPWVVVSSFIRYRLGQWLDVDNEISHTNSNTTEFSSQYHAVTLFSLLLLKWQFLFWVCWDSECFYGSYYNPRVMISPPHPAIAFALKPHFCIYVTPLRKYLFLKVSKVRAGCWGLRPSQNHTSMEKTLTSVHLPFALLRTLEKALPTFFSFFPL